MNTTEQLEAGIKRIQFGWIKGDLGDGDGYCLVGALNANLACGYAVTPAIAAVCGQIISECDDCAISYEMMTAPGSKIIQPESRVLWGHNDNHIDSQEDALLILKKALYDPINRVR